MSLPPPSLAGFTQFVRSVVGINSTVLPDDSPYLDASYQGALDLVNLQLAGASPNQYCLAVYNLGADQLINWTPDGADQTFFAELRDRYKINEFVAGVVSAATDNSTSSTLTVAEAMKNLTFGDLQNLKTPYGRQYLAIAQRVGTLWGMN